MVALDILDCIARMQTLIAGVLVFLGVIVTLGFNAWIARNDQRKKLKLEQLAIRTALIEELKIVKMGVEDGIEKIEKYKEANGLLVPSHTISDMYKTLLPRIGLLTSIQVEKVVFAYKVTIQFRENLTLFEGARIQKHHIYLPQAAFSSIITGLKNLIPHIDDAISSLSVSDMEGTK